MTDNEIIMRLRLFASQKLVVHQSEGWAIIMKDVLDIIDRLQEEIERLKKENNQFADIGKMYSEIKSEAIKEFAERVCEGRVSNDPVVIAVRCAVKEMTEGKAGGVNEQHGGLKNYVHS
jgi:FtsZ-binding cell division protein ZapB